MMLMIIIIIIIIIIYCNSVQNVLSSSWLSKNLKIHRTIILPVFLYGCKTWSLTLKEELG